MNSNVDVITDQSNTTVFVEQGPNVTVDGSIITVINAPANTTTTVIPGPVQIVTLGIQGPIGPQGPAGSGSTINGQCGASITVGTAVTLVGGLLYPADPTDASVNGLYVGVATESGLITDTITVAQLGAITLSGLVTGDRYFLGLNGVLSTTPVAAGANWFRYIGTAQSPTELVLVSSISVVLD